MAMGTIPIVATEVDMDNYYNPLVEGVHYIRARTPEDVNKKVKEISKEKWQTMSTACKAWWRENASVEGSWLLTKKILSEY